MVPAAEHIRSVKLQECFPRETPDLCTLYSACNQYSVSCAPSSLSGLTFDDLFSPIKNVYF